MRYLFVFLLFTSCFFSCKSKSSAPANDKVETGLALPDGFEGFYEKFHQDSLYQMAHIQFPVQGLRTTEGTIYHTQEEWRMQKELTEDSKFTRKIYPLGEDIVEDVIMDSKGEFGMKRRFAKFGEEWFLIYYSGMNHIAK